MAEASGKNPLSKYWNNSFQPYIPDEKELETSGWENKKKKFYAKVDAQFERKLGYSVEHGIGDDDLVTPEDDDLIIEKRGFEVAPSIKGKLFTLNLNVETGKFEKRDVTRIDDDFLDALRRNRVFAYPAGEKEPVQLSLSSGMDVNVSYQITKVPENEPTFLERFLAFITFGLVYGDKVAEYDKAVAAKRVVALLKQKGKNAGVLLGTESDALDEEEPSLDESGSMEDEPESEVAPESELEVKKEEPKPEPELEIKKEEPKPEPEKEPEKEPEIKKEEPKPEAKKPEPKKVVPDFKGKTVSSYENIFGEDIPGIRFRDDEHDNDLDDAEIEDIIDAAYEINIKSHQAYEREHAGKPGRYVPEMRAFDDDDGEEIEINLAGINFVADDLMGVIRRGMDEREEKPVKKELDAHEKREREKLENVAKAYGAEMDAVWKVDGKVNNAYKVAGGKNAQPLLGKRRLSENGFAEMVALTSMLPDVQKLALKKGVVGEGELANFDAFDPQEKDKGYTDFAKETTVNAIEKYEKGSTKYLDGLVKQGLDKGMAKLEGMDAFGKDAGKAYKLANSMVDVAELRTEINVGEERKAIAEGYANFAKLAVSAKSAMEDLARGQISNGNVNPDEQRKLLHTVIKANAVGQFMASGEIKPEDKRNYMLGLPASSEVSEMVDGILDDALERGEKMSVREMVTLFSDKKNLDQFVKEKVLDNPASKRALVAAKEVGRSAIEVGRNKDKNASAEMVKA